MVFGDSVNGPPTVHEQPLQRGTEREPVCIDAVGCDRFESCAISAIVGVIIEPVVGGLGEGLENRGHRFWTWESRVAPAAGKARSQFRSIAMPNEPRGTACLDANHNRKLTMRRTVSSDADSASSDYGCAGGGLAARNPGGVAVTEGIPESSVGAVGLSPKNPASMNAPRTASELPSVRLRDVHMRFAVGSAVLGGVNLEVPEGAFVSFLGPSGCGKSTLLRLIAGLIEPTNGEIVIGGSPAGESGAESFLIFQEANLLPWLRVRANVELPLKLRGMQKQDRRKRALELIELVGLKDAIDRFPRQLSGGMKMRVSIARALSVKPRLLLLDEPFGSLDAMTRDQLNEDLLEIRERDPFTACFVTHSVAEAVFLSSHIIVMGADPGRIVETISVPFAYPRRAELRESAAFLELLAQVTRASRTVKEISG